MVLFHAIFAARHLPPAAATLGELPLDLALPSLLSESLTLLICLARPTNCCRSRNLRELSRLRAERALRRFQLRLRAAAAMPPNLVVLDVVDDDGGGGDEEELVEG